MNQKEALLYAVKQGYSVTHDGRVISPNTEKPRKLVLDSRGYFVFNLGSCEKAVGIRVHRLVAYFKFGKKIFNKGVVVRHLDGNSRNNQWNNIAIGTQSDNMMDRSPLKRKAHAQVAARKQRKLSDEEAKELRALRAKGATYSELMSKFGLAKSTISYIVNNKTYI